MIMITNILNTLKLGPTIIGLDDILFVMQSLQKIAIEDVINQQNELMAILDLLEFSYCDSAIFEVNNLNKPLLQTFNHWLLDLAKNSQMARNYQDLCNYAETLITEFNM